MHSHTWTLIILHLVLWTALGYGIFLYAQEPRELQVLKILGSNEKDLSLPIYAQFIATQTLFFDRPLIAAEFAIPLYLPIEPLPIKISLYQNGKLLTWWKYPIEIHDRSEGYKTAHLRFMPSIPLQGNVELRFDGSDIPHELQDHAPRLFTETFDSAYPNGNYRIANNEKKGDISLGLIEQKTNYQIFSEDMQKNSFGAAIQILRWLSIFLLLTCLPSIAVNPFFMSKRSNP